MIDCGDDFCIVMEMVELILNESLVIVFVLCDDGQGQLWFVLQLFNVECLEFFGKFGEWFYVMCFVGDCVYFVIFFMIDLFYVIDFSDLDQFLVVGEFEIIGYLDYLYFVGKNYFVGVGKDVVFGGDFCGVWVQGVKVLFYDVSDFVNFFELDIVVFGCWGSESLVF